VKGGRKLRRGQTNIGSQGVLSEKSPYIRQKGENQAKQKTRVFSRDEFLVENS